jgi:hypothetical protein
MLKKKKNNSGGKGLTNLEDINVKVRSALTKDFSNSAVRSKYSVEWKKDID